MARWGGEEFAILLPDARLAVAAVIGERLRTAVANARVADAGPITVSLGLTISEAPDDDVSTLVERADEALYRAKKTGRNRLCMSVAENDGHSTAVLEAKRRKAPAHRGPKRAKASFQ